MPKANFAAISRVEVKAAALLFNSNRDIGSIAADCATEALKVLHDGLSNPDDKLRLASATAILNAHCKLAALKQPQVGSELPYEERVARLTQALQEPLPELHEALARSRWQQVIDP